MIKVIGSSCYAELTGDTNGNFRSMRASCIDTSVHSLPGK